MQNSLELPSAHKIGSISKKQHETGAGKAGLPLDIFVAILEQLPYDKILSMNTRRVIPVLQTKVNQLWCLASQDLHSLSQYPDVLDGLVRLFAECYEEEDIQALKKISGQARHVKMELEVDENCIEDISKCHEIVDQLTWLEVREVMETESILVLAEICHNCPQLELSVFMNLFLERLIPHPAIINQLRTVTAVWPKVDEFAPLEDICRRNPAIKVNMAIADEPWEITRFPALLQALDLLDIKIYTDEDHLNRLDDVCGHLPETAKIFFTLMTGARKLKSCGHLLARLDFLDFRQLVTTKEDAAFLAELPKLSPRLTVYKADLPACLLKYLVDSAIAAAVFFMENLIHVTWKRNHRLKIICRLKYLPVLLNRAEELQAVRRLELYFLEPEDKTCTFLLLEDLPKKFPKLEQLNIRWGSPRRRSCTKLARPLGKALHRWRSMDRLVMRCPEPLMNMLQRKWRNAGVDLTGIEVCHKPWPL